MPDETTVPAEAIGAAPEAEHVVLGLAEYQSVLSAYGGLQTQNEALLAEVESLRGGAEAARAALIRPYAWAVFWFVCAYGFVVAAILIAEGFGKSIGFSIDNAVMGILVGSTAVSAIGLVLTVVKGLFPVPKE